MTTEEFNVNKVIDISEEEIDNWESMSLEEIQAFLETQKRGSGKYHISTYKNKRGQSIAELIHLSARYWNINPKILLATLQKESSLVTQSFDSSRRFFYLLDRAFGFGILDSGKTYTLYKGFDMQVFFAARLFRKYIDKYRKIKGNSIMMKVDYLQTVVRPENSLTYALYTYTPHTSAQKLFKQVWEMFNF